VTSSSSITLLRQYSLNGHRHCTSALDGPFDVRARRVAAREGLSAAEADRAVKESDTQREAWHRRYFAVGTRTPYLYDLTLNTQRMPDTQAAEAICHAAGVVGRQEIADHARLQAGQR